MTTPTRRALIVAGAMAVASESADAHIVAARLGDFYIGALHPLTDLQDIILWAALGIVAGYAGARQGRWLVVILPVGLLAGLAMQVVLGIGALGAVANALIMVGVGLLLTAGIRLNAAGLGALAFALAVTRGAVNAIGIAPETNLPLFGAGLACSGYAAITLVMALTVAFQRAGRDQTQGWRIIAIRVCGSWIAAVGLMIGGLALKSGAG